MSVRQVHLVYKVLVEVMLYDVIVSGCGLTYLHKRAKFSYNEITARERCIQIIFNNGDIGHH